MEEQNSKSVLPVILAIVITVVVVGGGVYFWQNAPVSNDSELQDQITALQEELATLKQAPSEPTESTTKTTPTPQPTSSNETVLLNVPNYGFKFVATKQCASHYVAKKVIPDYETEAKAVYEVHFANPEALNWVGPLMTYSVMDQTAYDNLADFVFGQPKIRFILDSGLLVTAYDPQDGPAEWPANDTCQGDSYQLKKT